MSLTFKGRPIHFSLKWLKPPPVPPDGSMTLFEHLRELRYRLVVAMLAIIIAFALFATALLRWIGGRDREIVTSGPTAEPSASPLRRAA